MNTPTERLIPPEKYEFHLWHWLSAPGYKSSDHEPQRWLWTGSRWIAAVWVPHKNAWVRMLPIAPEEMAESHRYVGPAEPPLCKCPSADRWVIPHDPDCPGAQQVYPDLRTPEASQPRA